MTTDPTPLDAGNVAAYLASRGLLPHGPAQVVALSGGVSNDVLAVRAGGRRLVVKQALSQLRVAEEWLAKRERALTEAAALRLAGKLTPGAVPPVVDVDDERCVIVIEEAPLDATSWKERLLAGDAEPGIGARLGTILAQWHSATAARRDTLALFDDAEAFEQLRVDPFHRTVARRHEDLAAAVLALVAAMQRQRTCLVHGDFSPKNVLVGRHTLWVIDFEVAHLGDPAFDVAFLLCHLLLKAIHRPSSASAYRSCARAFLATYSEGWKAPRDNAHLRAHLGCLLLARADGKSPAEYLTPAERGSARTLGRALLLGEVDEVDALWDMA